MSRNDYGWRKSSYSNEGANCVFVARDWQKSSYSGEGSNCLYAAAPEAHTIALRESDEPDVILTTTPVSLRALIRAVGSGQGIFSH